MNIIFNHNNAKTHCVTIAERQRNEANIKQWKQWSNRSRRDATHAHTHTERETKAKYHVGKQLGSFSGIIQRELPSI